MRSGGIFSCGVCNTLKTRYQLHPAPIDGVRICWHCHRQGLVPPHYLDHEPARPTASAWTYPLTTHQHRELREAQGGRCAICRAPGRLVADHVHNPDRLVRALLCTQCNSGLGQFRDSPALLEAARRYLLDRGWAQTRREPSLASLRAGPPKGRYEVRAPRPVI